MVTTKQFCRQFSEPGQYSGMYDRLIFTSNFFTLETKDNRKSVEYLVKVRKIAKKFWVIHHTVYGNFLLKGNQNMQKFY
jgi:hypothetical protein